MRLLRKLYFALGRLLRKNGQSLWETVPDLTENVPYVVTGMLPVNLFGTLRPLIVCRADHLQGPMIMHDSSQVETRILLATTEDLALAHGEKIGLGDVVKQIDGRLLLLEKKRIDYSRSIALNVVA